MLSIFHSFNGLQCKPENSEQSLAIFNKITLNIAKYDMHIGNTEQMGKSHAISADKGRLSLFNIFIDMRTTVSLSISCGKNMFLLENFNKNTFFYMKWTN